MCFPTISCFLFCFTKVVEMSDNLFASITSSESDDSHVSPTGPAFASQPFHSVQQDVDNTENPTEGFPAISSDLQVESLAFVKDEAACREAFLARVRLLKASNKSANKLLDMDEHRKIITILAAYKNAGDNNDALLSVYRQHGKCAYEIRKNYRFETNGSGKNFLYRIGDAKERLCVPIEQMFDIIRDVHCFRLGHKKVAQVHGLISQTYYSITKKVVQTFIDICPICNGQCPKKSHKAKGAKKPIESESFRNRFQFDLVDYRQRPSKIFPNDDDAEEYRWLLVMKDHFTRFTHGKPLRRKSAQEVARAIYEICSMFGYPVIAHMDNGKELKNDDVLKMLLRMNLSCSTVHGKPRTPREQGSVECANRSIKAMIDNFVLQEKTRPGGNPDAN